MEVRGRGGSQGKSRKDIIPPPAGCEMCQAGSDINDTISDTTIKTDRARFSGLFKYLPGEQTAV